MNNVEVKATKILMETEQYMKQNKLTLNEGKTEIIVFKIENLPTSIALNLEVIHGNQPMNADT